MSKVPSLLELCIDTLASHIELCSELQGVPEEIVLDVFERVLVKGKLTPRVLHLFEATDHTSVSYRIKALNIQDVPPLIPETRNPWLGQNKGWY